MPAAQNSARPAVAAAGRTQTRRDEFGAIRRRPNTTRPIRRRVEFDEFGRPLKAASVRAYQAL